MPMSLCSARLDASWTASQVCMARLRMVSSLPLVSLRNLLAKLFDCMNKLDRILNCRSGSGV